MKRTVFLAAAVVVSLAIFIALMLSWDDLTVAQRALWFVALFVVDGIVILLQPSRKSPARHDHTA
jgi:hypothetical protein